MKQFYLYQVRFNLNVLGLSEEFDLDQHDTQRWNVIADKAVVTGDEVIENGRVVRQSAALNNAVSCMLKDLGGRWDKLDHIRFDGPITKITESSQLIGTPTNLHPLQFQKRAPFMTMDSWYARLFGGDKPEREII